MNLYDPLLSHSPSDPVPRRGSGIRLSTRLETHCLLARVRICDHDRHFAMKKILDACYSFSLVVFDPPHFVSVGPKSYMGLKYGNLNKDTWQDDLRQGFAECFRVLRPNGTLIFKWNEHDIPLRQILSLTPVRPLFGHPSGKAQKTHWVCFMKL